MELPVSFIHHPPENCNYEIKNFRLHIISIWLCDYSEYHYTTRSPINTIWGFYNTKTRQYHAPINSKKMGKVVSIDKTTAYTAMQIDLTPLELAFNV